MLRFTVKYLGFLKRVPFLPHFFEAFLRLSCLVFNKRVIDFIDNIESIVSTWDNVIVTIHKYGGIQFNYGSKEIGHMHGNGLVDILFDRKRKNELIANGMAEEHHLFKHSGWVSIYIKTQEDADKAITLLRMSLLKHVN